MVIDYEITNWNISEVWLGILLINLYRYKAAAKIKESRLQTIKANN